MISPKLAPPVNKCQSYANIFLFTKCGVTQRTPVSLSQVLSFLRVEKLYIRTKKLFMASLWNTKYGLPILLILILFNLGEYDLNIPVHTQVVVFYVDFE